MSCGSSICACDISRASGGNQKQSSFDILKPKLVRCFAVSGIACLVHLVLIKIADPESAAFVGEAAASYVLVTDEFHARLVGIAVQTNATDCKQHRSGHFKSQCEAILFCM